MTKPIWQTTSGFLGTLSERITMSINLTATNASSYSIISGQLPTGLYLNNSTGVILGTPCSVPVDIESTFVIRATNTQGVSDRTFSFDVTGPSNPVWITSSGLLPVGLNGEFYSINKEYVDYQLRAETDILSKGNTLKYYIGDNEGNLPPNLKLSTDGRITGYINDSLKIDKTVTLNGGYDTEYYDAFPYEHSSINQSLANSSTYIKSYQINYVAKERPARVILTESHDIKDKDQIFIQNIKGMTTLNGNFYYCKVIDIRSISLYTNEALSTPVDALGFTSYISDGKVYWGSTQQLQPEVINRIYQFYVTVTDGIQSSRRLFDIKVLDHESLRVDTTYMSVDDADLNASAGYILAPIWQSKYGEKLPKVQNLGTVRAGKPQIFSIYDYDPYPLDGPVLYDWNTVGVNPDIKLYVDSQINLAHLPTKNLKGQNAVYYKNAEILPVKGMKIQFNEFIPNTDSTIYTITGVIKLTETTGILNIDQPLSQQLPDSRIFYVGTVNQHPPGLTLDPMNGNLYGQLMYQPAFALGYRFTVKVIKIDQATGDDTLYNAVGSNNARIVGKVYTETNNSFPSNVLNAETYTGSIGDIVLVSMTPAVNADLLLPLMDGTVRAYVFTGNSWVYLGETVASNQIYLLNVLGDVQSSIQFVSTSSLGTLIPGEISEIAIKAINLNTNYAIEYEIIQGQLPQGLILNQDGTIQGKIVNTGQTYFDFTSTSHSFGSLSIDGGQTSVDKNLKFTVRASDVYRLSSIDKEFFITVNTDTLTDYTRIYVKPFLSKEQRFSYSTFVTDPIIFDPVLIYRPNDPEFGIQKQIKMLLETGIEQVDINLYAEAMQEYFHRKSFYFGEVKSVLAQDQHGNDIYEIIYVDIIDNQMIGNIASPLYATSVENMRYAIESIQITPNSIISVDERLYPKYMTTVQQDTGVPLGFIKAVPLCYTIPGGSIKILSRIKNALDTNAFDFKQYHFDTDRIIIENVKDTEKPGWLMNPTDR